MPSPFEASYGVIEADIEAYVDVVFATLKSGFMTLPKGDGFIDYPVFENGYEILKKTTNGFSDLNTDRIVLLAFQQPITLIVLRAVLGFTPSEWAEAASELTDTKVTQGAARSIDRNVRLSPDKPLKPTGVTGERVKALVVSACQLLTDGPNNDNPAMIHRLDKADTRSGFSSVAPLADIGIPYALLLYERFLGRPFAGHRDSVSELVGDLVETAIEKLLNKHGISFRKTKRAERIEGFEQVPDFIIPNEFNPQVIIEAKLAEDDGTARDKVTRIQHLHTMSMRDRSPEEGPRYEVIACIAGRGFKQRRQDMKKLLEATRGKVFTLQTMPEMVHHSRLREFVTKL
ncbi:MAG: hypothetical protein GDA49_11410 [Rhodospirillales bacterium]|nr:hypothetical protein [Rhodospirillales bacterium]